jgi:hypothetical protein
MGSWVDVSEQKLARFDVLLTGADNGMQDMLMMRMLRNQYTRWRCMR